VLAQSVLLFSVVKFAGAAYLIYLGIQAIRHRGRGPTAADPPRPASTLRILREGFIVGATNPKSIIFFAVLPQFVDYSAGAIPLQLATLGALFLAIALASDSGWALIAGTARRWFASSPPADRRAGHHRRGDDDRAGRNPCPGRKRGGSAARQVVGAASQVVHGSGRGRSYSCDEWG